MAKKSKSTDWVMVIAVAVVLVGIGSIVVTTNITGYAVKDTRFQLPNAGAEEWGAEQSYFDAKDIPVGWDFKCYSGACRIVRTNNAFAGKSAVYMSSFAGTAGSVYTVYLLPRYEYTLSVWVKSNDEAVLRIKRNDFGGQSTTYHSGSGEWEKLTLTVEPTSYVPQGWDVLIETIKNGDSLIWDNAELVQNKISVGYREDKTLYR